MIDFTPPSNTPCGRCGSDTTLGSLCSADLHCGEPIPEEQRARYAERVRLNNETRARYAAALSQKGAPE
jgi:hypothetical protein